VSIVRSGDARSGAAHTSLFVGTPASRASRRSVRSSWWRSARC